MTEIKGNELKTFWNSIAGTSDLKIGVHSMIKDLSKEKKNSLTLLIDKNKNTNTLLVNDDIYEFLDKLKELNDFPEVSGTKQISFSNEVKSKIKKICII